MNANRQEAVPDFSGVKGDSCGGRALKSGVRTALQSGQTLLLNLTTRLKRRQRAKTGEGIVKVNLGSGLCVADGWINVDGGIHALLSRWPEPVLRLVHGATSVRQTHSLQEYLRILRGHRFVHHRFDYGVPFEDESVDFVFSSHMLEHLFLDDARRLVSDIFRVLKPGGLVRIGVPDLAVALDLYRRGDKEQALGFFFTPSRSGLFDRHHYLYDFDLLRDLLASVGFVEIERRQYRTGRLPDVSVLDNRPEETLFVEAGKPLAAVRSANGAAG